MGKSALRAASCFAKLCDHRLVQVADLLSGNDCHSCPRYVYKSLCSPWKDSSWPPMTNEDRKCGRLIMIATALPDLSQRCVHSISPVSMVRGGSKWYVPLR